MKKVPKADIMRYAIQIWAYAITRSARPNGQSDDYMLSLIEEFMRLHAEETPRFVVETFEGS